MLQERQLGRRSGDAEEIRFVVEIRQSKSTPSTAPHKAKPARAPRRVLFLINS